MSFRKYHLALLAVLLLTFNVPTSASPYRYIPPIRRATTVHTTCPACYFLSAQHNQTARLYDKLRDQRSDYQHENQKLNYAIENLEKLKKATQKQYQTTGAPGAAKTYKNTLSKIRKNKAKIQKNQKGLDAINKKLPDIEKQLKEDRKRYNDCIKKHCNKKKYIIRTHRNILRYKITNYHPSEIEPSYINSACVKCNKYADKCNEIREYIDWAIDSLKLHNRSNKKHMGDEKYHAMVERNYNKLYRRQTAWAAAYKNYMDCLEKHCKPKAKPYGDAYLELDRGDRYAMTTDMNRNNAIGLTADFGTTHRTASFGGPFRASENGTRIDGVGGTIFYQRYFENAPEWSVITDAGYPGDHHKVVLRDHFDPLSPYVSDIRITKSWFVGFGAERQVVEFGGDCKDNGGNSFNSGCNTVSLGAGLSVTSQELKANIGELEITTASDTDLLVAPFVVADLTLPVCTHSPECSTDAIAFVFDVKVTWLPRQRLSASQKS